MTTATGHAANWRSASACLHADPDLFFPASMAPWPEAEANQKPWPEAEANQTRSDASKIAKAKAICAGCTVRVQCLDYARAHDPIFGIWGGATPEERQRVRRRERRAARARAKAATAA